MDTQGYLDMDLLRFTTAGSVDDGKSTLIGRLMYDSKSIFEDQLEAIEASSERRGDEQVNLALLTDGLKAEREAGITIDVAYRYFATPKRKFIIADTPGHIEYTRNMVTGASTANLAIILIDARNGVIEQTCRHSFIASLLGIKHIVVCVNKMDLVDFSQEQFEKIKKQYQEFSSKLNVTDIQYIPISALKGDNVVEQSKNTSWYKGKTLLKTLETVEINADINFDDARFPVQRVIRPQSEKFHDFRGFAGKVEGGVFKVGDSITALPSGTVSKIKKIYLGDSEVKEIYPPMSATLTLEDEIDITRGDLISKTDNQPEVVKELDVMLCWMNDKPLTPRGKYTIRHTANETMGMVLGVDYKVDINTLNKSDDDSPVSKNDICRAKIKVSKPLMIDSYSKNRGTGSIIIVDNGTNETVGAGMVV
ncbi:MAG: sulfate adenylyltransferase [Flavobacteriales bacterium]|nr:sulfate adenylyltransferase [Flavobacteriales bacterium]MBO72033.1 sulfate adenylyltransferase [Flavobacteriales bacterium]|tara:strand:- start:187 stop:1452 length:1266 start_codon:yes stop_codon:yes gene_type:complete